MRVRRVPGTTEKLLGYSCFVADHMAMKGSWRRGYERLEAEFGGGKGDFAIKKAMANPQIDFVMVEVVPEILIKAAIKYRAMGDKAPKNLRFTMFNLKDLGDVFEKGELDRIYLNFSDPWPKKKHFKRRLTYRKFLLAYQNVLSSSGGIEFKTDDRNLFEFTLTELSETIMRLEYVSLDLHANEPEGNIQTEYERKFLKSGKKIYMLTCSKRKQKKQEI